MLLKAPCIRPDILEMFGTDIASLIAAAVLVACLTRFGVPFLIPFSKFSIMWTVHTSSSFSGPSFGTECLKTAAIVPPMLSNADERIGFAAIKPAVKLLIKSVPHC